CHAGRYVRSCATAVAFWPDQPPVAPEELVVRDRPPLSVVPFHHPIAWLSRGLPFHRPEHQVLADLPGAVGTDAPPASMTQPHVAGTERLVPDRALVPVAVEDPPVPGIAAEPVA